MRAEHDALPPQHGVLTANVDMYRTDCFERCECPLAMRRVPPEEKSFALRAMTSSRHNTTRDFSPKKPLASQLRPPPETREPNTTHLLRESPLHCARLALHLLRSCARLCVSSTPLAKSGAEAGILCA
tara:strand:+ start:983 stop:1366 length:384 start_codon:yes stop_codon:yes gene_type:complete